MKTFTNYLNLQIILSNSPGLQNLRGAKEEYSDFIGITSFLYSFIPEYKITGVPFIIGSTFLIALVWCKERKNQASKCLVKRVEVYHC